MSASWSHGESSESSELESFSGECNIYIYIYACVLFMYCIYVFYILYIIYVLYLSIYLSISMYNIIVMKK